MNANATTWEQVLAALKTYWGYDSFRHPQDQVVRCLLQQQDALILLPTGFGKSICFQIPALLGSGLTLVISPLIALMEDQVQDLWKRKLPAACLHGEVSKTLRLRIFKALEEERLRLLYLSPETLFSPAVWGRLQGIQINGLMIDESHTLVHWGDSFRPDYRRLGTVRRALGQHFPIAAFTATADPYTQSVLQSVLDLQSPAVIKGDPARLNLHLSIAIAWTPAGRRQQLKRFIQAKHGSSGLVYVRTRSDGRALSAWLHQQGLATEVYHGGLGSQQRRQLEQDWLQGSMPFLVCTNAFGMGINKPDVRWVAHFQPPPALADYIQEVGRGGRDGQPATALMLVSEPTGSLDSGDQDRQAFFDRQRHQIREQAAQLLHSLPDQGSYQQVGKVEAKVALALLHQAGCLRWRDPFTFEILHRPARLPPSGAPDPGLGMAQLIQTRGCRWQVLLEQFGYPPGDPCGVCDNCRRPAVKGFQLFRSS
jgi:ATP-dependent DNA helicase RecQ